MKGEEEKQKSRREKEKRTDRRQTETDRRSGQKRSAEHASLFYDLQQVD